MEQVNFDDVISISDVIVLTNGVLSGSEDGDCFEVVSWSTDGYGWMDG